MCYLKSLSKRLNRKKLSIKKHCRYKTGYDRWLVCLRKTAEEWGSMHKAHRRLLNLANSSRLAEHFILGRHRHCSKITTSRHHLRSIKIVDLLNSSTEEGAAFTDRREGVDHPCPCNGADLRFAEAVEVGRHEGVEEAAAVVGTVAVEDAVAAAEVEVVVIGEKL